MVRNSKTKQNQQQEINPIVSTAIIPIGVGYSDIMKESVTLAI